MIKIFIVYDNIEQLDLFKHSTFKNLTPLVEYINMNTKDGRKNGFKLKGEWGAKTNPFCIIFDGDKAIKAFYSENDWEDNAIVQLINYLKENYD